MMTAVLCLLVFHGLIGGLDVILNHELIERLPKRLWAKSEEALHGVREFIFAAIFGGLAWFEWHGAMALVLGLIIAAEYLVSFADTLLEEKTRRLPLIERALHTILFINLGAYTALLVPQLIDWGRMPSGMQLIHHGMLTWLLSALSVLSFTWGLRDTLSYFVLRKKQHKIAGA
jgi:phosphatidylglycerophosphate synthase